MPDRFDLGRCLSTFERFFLAFGFPAFESPAVDFLALALPALELPAVAMSAGDFLAFAFRGFELPALDFPALEPVVEAAGPKDSPFLDRESVEAVVRSDRSDPFRPARALESPARDERDGDDVRRDPDRDERRLPDPRDLVASARAGAATGSRL